MIILMYIERKSSIVLDRLKKSFPIVAITGPRQSGKTTLAKHKFSNYEYVSLENPNVLDFANEDPISFLNQFKDGVIIDEIQKAPELFSYLQEMADDAKEMGKIVLTGSSQFTLRSGISQSLAGRIGYLELLPLSISELKKNKDLDEQMSTGFYPALYDRKIAPNDWYANYVRTYVERDVNQLINIKDNSKFRLFLKLCAGRTGQLVNLSNLGNEVGVSHTTINEWLSILEISYIIFRLPPHFQNFSKRLVKSSKIYFYDVGLLCWLLGIKSGNELSVYPLRGQIFENLIVADAYKYFFNIGEQPSLYFWRDNKGLEVDLLCERKNKLHPIEIKSGATILSNMFKNIKKWKELSGDLGGELRLIYGGNKQQQRTDIEIFPWFSVDEIFSTFDSEI